MKIKLFTHGADLDGVGCAILAYLAFERENVAVEYCDYKNVDGKVEELLSNVEDRSRYDKIFITDISICDELAKAIDTWINPFNIRLFDHHATALELNKHEWCEVLVEDETGLKMSGTALFYNYLVRNGFFDHYIMNDRVMGNICRFVEIVRDYDTWRWKELGEEGIVCKQINDLLDIYGREEFIDWAIREIFGTFTLSPVLDVFPRFSEKDLALLYQKQKDIDIYVAEKEKQLRVATDHFDKIFGWVFAERYFSELGNRLCEMHPEIEYVAMIDISKGVVSFRSVKEDIDLGGVIAHSLGGGGHKKAAGSRFNAGEIGKFVSWSVLNTKPDWSDIMPQYLGEPVKKEEQDDTRTILETFDTLTFEQKNRVYQIIGDILGNNRKMGGKYVNLSFLSNQEQKDAVRAIIDQAIMDNRKDARP